MFQHGLTGLRSSTQTQTNFLSFFGRQHKMTCTSRNSLQTEHTVLYNGLQSEKRFSSLYRNHICHCIHSLLWAFAVCCLTVKNLTRLKKWSWLALSYINDKTRFASFILNVIETAVAIIHMVHNWYFLKENYTFFSSFSSVLSHLL